MQSEGLIITVGRGRRYVRVCVCEKERVRETEGDNSGECASEEV